MEIEKKYLVQILPDLNQISSKTIIQAYIATDPVIRIRQLGEDYFLTIKSKGHMTREEFELPISENQFKKLWAKIEGTPIEKIRYYLPLENNLMAELDLFHGVLEGLATVEVEFTSEEAANAFVPPVWFGQDITFDKRYKNNSLTQYGKPIL